MAKKMTVAIFGAGRIGKVHAQTILNYIPNISIKYICDPFQGAREWVESLNGPKFISDPETIFADKEVDAVLICSSTDTHVPHTIAAAKAGKHIFCEKPLDQDLEKITAAIDAVEAAGVKFQIGFNRRFDHNFRAAKKAIADGRIGKVEFVNIISRDPGLPSAEYIKGSGGMFMDMSIHDFDMARFLAGSEVEEVYVKAAVFVDPIVGELGDCDSAAIILTFKNGVIATINNSRRAAYGYDQRVEVCGALGKVEIGNDTKSTAVISDAFGVIAEKPLHFFMDRYTQSYVDEVKEFIEAIGEDKKTPTDVVDAIKSVEIAKAALRSAREGMPVKL